MNSRLTLRLPSTLNRKLAHTAKRLQRTRSHVVRLALEQFLNADKQTQPIDRVRDLLGRVASGVPDLGQNHREHLIRRVRCDR